MRSLFIIPLLKALCFFSLIAITNQSFAIIDLRKTPEYKLIATNQQNPKLKLIITDSETKKPIAAMVKVLDMKNKKVLFSNSLNDTLTLNLIAGGDYRIISKAESHLFNEVELDLSKQKVGPIVAINLALTPIKLGAKLQLNEVFFENNSAKLQETSMAELTEVYEVLWEHPNLVIQIAAHTDNVGTHDDNMELSGRRAQAIIEILKDKGVPEEMMIAKGYGETKPLAPNSTEEGRQKNRRVEFIIVDIK